MRIYPIFPPPKAPSSFPFLRLSLLACPPTLDHSLLEAGIWHQSSCVHNLGSITSKPVLLTSPLAPGTGLGRLDAPTCSPEWEHSVIVYNFRSLTRCSGQCPERHSTASLDHFHFYLGNHQSPSRYGQDVVVTQRARLLPHSLRYTSDLGYDDQVLSP